MRSKLVKSRNEQSRATLFILEIFDSDYLTTTFTEEEREQFKFLNGYFRNGVQALPVSEVLTGLTIIAKAMERGSSAKSAKV